MHDDNAAVTMKTEFKVRFERKLFLVTTNISLVLKSSWNCIQPGKLALQSGWNLPPVTSR